MLPYRHTWPSPSCGQVPDCTVHVLTCLEPSSCLSPGLAARSPYVWHAAWIDDIEEVRKGYTPNAVPPSPQVIFSAKPMWSPANESVPLLLWNMKWHSAYGVTEHIYYGSAHVSEMAADPRLKVRTG